MKDSRLPVRVASATVACLAVGGAGWALTGLAAPADAPRTGAFARSSPYPLEDGGRVPSSSPVTDVPAKASVGSMDAAGRRPADLSSIAAADQGAVPTRVVVPSEGIDLPVVPAGVDSAGSMQLPSGSFTAAWYRFGPGAGVEPGAAVIAAHVSSRDDGRGPFARLGGLDPGARILVTTAGGVVAYEVVSVEQVAKLSLDTGSLFDRTGGHRLHLVTCGGRYDAAANSYEDNVVVVARPTA